MRHHFPTSRDFALVGSVGPCYGDVVAFTTVPDALSMRPTRPVEKRLQVVTLKMLILSQITPTIGEIVFDRFEVIMRTSMNTNIRTTKQTGKKITVE